MAHADGLVEYQPVVEPVPALPGVFGGGPWIFRVVDADHADAAGGPDDLDEFVQCHLGVFLAALVVRLVADRLHPAVHAGPIGRFGDHLDGGRRRRS